MISEDNQEINDPAQAKEYIAKFYEELYQARESRPEYTQTSEDIKNENRETYTRLKQARKVENITMKEMNTTIKKLKNGKALGPDEIPNEISMRADAKTRRIYLKIMNNILHSENIPNQWQESKITRFYKGRGKKGKCSAERGITLSSNFGKENSKFQNPKLREHHR